MEQRVVIITGGGRGIGAATAHLAARRGYTVLISYLNRAEAALGVVDSIVREGGVAAALHSDARDEEHIVRLFDAAVALGPLYGLVNNAGILEPQCRLDEMDAERIHRIFATNAIGALLCAREAVRRMSTKHGGLGGAIVNVSSVGAVLGSANEYIDYAASKGAVDTMTIGLSKEVAHEGIRVNAVRPGLIYTEMHADGGEPGRVERLKEHVPMQRGGDPEEVAEAILWLLSEQASYVTGSIINVAGGR